MLFVLLAAVILYRWLCPRKEPHVLNIYFGVPGSGKTTFAAWLTRRALRQSCVITWCQSHPGRISARIVASRFFRRRTDVYSNVPITGAYALDPAVDIGTFMISDAKVIIDEAGVEYNNRAYKTMPKDVIYWYKYHRHYECSVDVFSQSYDDMDITLRRLAQNYYILKKSLIPFCVVTKKIRRKVGIDEQTHQIMDQYSFGLPLVGTRWIFSPPLWKLFNSYSRKELPHKIWRTW